MLKIQIGDMLEGAIRERFPHRNPRNVATDVLFGYFFGKVDFPIRSSEQVSGRPPKVPVPPEPEPPRSQKGARDREEQTAILVNRNGIKKRFSKTVLKRSLQRRHGISIRGFMSDLCFIGVTRTCDGY
jgi:hypothetical protein